ncbi:unnamed protein product, partial [Coccothraustes coccothraustes]
MAAEPGPGPGPDAELDELLESALDDFERSRPAPPPPASSCCPLSPPSAADSAKGSLFSSQERFFQELFEGELAAQAAAEFQEAMQELGSAGAPAGGAVPETLGSCWESRWRRGLAAGSHLLPQGDPERAGQERQRPPEFPGIRGGAGQGPGGAGAGRGRRRRRPARHAQHHGVPAVQGRALPLPQGDHREVPGVAAAARGLAVGGAAGAVLPAAGADAADLRGAGAGAAGGARGAAPGALRDPAGPDAAAAGPGPPSQGAGRGHATRTEPDGGAVPPHV